MTSILKANRHIKTGLPQLEQEERNLRPEELQGISQKHTQFPLYIQGFVQNWLRGIELSIHLPKVSMCSADISSCGTYIQWNIVYIFIVCIFHIYNGILNQIIAQSVNMQKVTGHLLDLRSN